MISPIPGREPESILTRKAEALRFHQTSFSFGVKTKITYKCAFAGPGRARLFYVLKLGCRIPTVMMPGGGRTDRTEGLGFGSVFRPTWLGYPDRAPNRNRQFRPNRFLEMSEKVRFTRS